MTDLDAREQGAASVLAFDEVRRPIEPRLVDLFEELNAHHFDASLPVVPVCQGIPDAGNERVDLDGMVSLQVYPRPGVPSKASVTIFLADELFETPWGSEDDRWRKVADTLLHQMVHLAVDVDALGGAHPFEEHHGQHFAEECNRIGERAGWKPVLASTEVVHRDQDAAGWPDNAIPESD